MTEQTEGAGVEVFAELVRIVCERGRISALGMAELVDFIAAREAAAEVRGAQAVLAAVEELHYTVDGEWCQHDGFSWPCSTVRDAAAAAAGGGGARVITDIEPREVILGDPNGMGYVVSVRPVEEEA